MIPTAEQLDEIASLGHGDLERVRYPVLLAALVRGRRTVAVHLVRKPVEKQVYFYRGGVVDCRSNLVHETLGRFLVATGKLSEEDFHSTLSDSLSRQIPLGEVLMERDLLSAEDLYRNLQQSLARKLLDPFTWQSGSFELRQVDEGLDTSLKVKTPQLILTGILKLSHPKEVMAAIQPLLSEPMAANPAPPLRPEEVTFAGAVGRVLSALQERPQRMDELAHASRLPPETLGRILYGLALLEVMVPQSRVAELAQRAEAAEAETAGPAAAAAPAQRGRILEAFLSFRRKDAFDLLGVDEAVDRHGLEEAFLEYSREFAPWSAGGGDLTEKARTLFLAGAEGFAELADNERRAAAESRRRTLQQEKAARPTQPMIETSLLDPALQYEKGMELLRKEEWKRALEFLQFAADVDPQNALYRAEAALCRYRLSPLLHRDQALEDLREAVRIDPKCGEAGYSLGLVLMEEGIHGEAEDQLQRVIKLMAPDRRPIEALKKLRGK